MSPNELIVWAANEAVKMSRVASKAPDPRDPDRFNFVQARRCAGAQGCLIRFQFSIRRAQDGDLRFLQSLWSEYGRREPEPRGANSGGFDRPEAGGPASRAGEESGLCCA